MFERARAIEFCKRDPVATVLIRSGLERNARELCLGYFSDDGELSALCWNGAYLVPYGFDEAGLDALATHLKHTERIASSLVGPADQVMGLWERIEASYPSPYDIRENQPSMVYSGHPQVRPDPQVRHAEIGESNIVLPASAAMFTEEVGYDPTAFGNAYAMRVSSLISGRRTFVRMGLKDGAVRVEFKADIGADAGEVAQIQGVWTAPDLRGQGIASRAMVAVAELARKRYPTVSLYVNDFNLPARRAYEKAGFEQVGTYATVLL